MNIKSIVALNQDKASWLQLKPMNRRTVLMMSPSVSPVVLNDMRINLAASVIPFFPTGYCKCQNVCDTALPFGFKLSIQKPISLHSPSNLFALAVTIATYVMFVPYHYYTPNCLSIILFILLFIRSSFTFGSSRTLLFVYGTLWRVLRNAKQSIPVYQISNRFLS